MEQPAAAAPPAGGWRGSMRKSRRGCSLLNSAIRLVSAIGAMPAVECLPGRMGVLASFPPGVEPVVENEARKVGEREIGRGDGGAIGGGPRQQLASRLHRGFLDERDLVPLHELAPPGVDL